MIINEIFFLLFLVPENVDERLKRQKIEAALCKTDTSLLEWQEFAKSEYGLINGKFPIYAQTSNNFF